MEGGGEGYDFGVFGVAVASESKEVAAGSLEAEAAVAHVRNIWMSIKGV